MTATTWLHMVLQAVALDIGFQGHISGDCSSPWSHFSLQREAEREIAWENFFPLQYIHTYNNSFAILQNATDMKGFQMLPLCKTVLDQAFWKSGWILTTSMDSGSSQNLLHGTAGGKTWSRMLCKFHQLSWNVAQESIPLDFSVPYTCMFSKLYKIHCVSWSFLILKSALMRNVTTYTETLNLCWIPSCLISLSLHAVLSWLLKHAFELFCHFKWSTLNYFLGSIVCS